METDLEDVFELVKDIPPGTWVAISEEQMRVLASGSDALTVIDEARHKSKEVPLIMRVPEPILWAV